jgi:hypothetical protein
VYVDEQHVWSGYRKHKSVTSALAGIGLTAPHHRTKSLRKRTVSPQGGERGKSPIANRKPTSP